MDDSINKDEGSIEMTLTDNSVTVLKRRYLAKDKKGNIIETTDEMWRRVANNLALPEEEGQTRDHWSYHFYHVMSELLFVPNSPTIMNAGRELQQLSACFVLPIEDDLEKIFERVKQTAMIHKTGGGTGFSFSRLRPEGDIVGSTGGIASGPISFMRAFDTATDVVKQGGTRRGANMAILHCSHPDIVKFVNMKRTPGVMENFNVSVGVTDKFMAAMVDNEPFDLINPTTGEVVETINPSLLFENIVEASWETGDPGIVFLDRINADNPNPQLGEIESTNPCGEQPLLPFESCNLGSINLGLLVDTEGSFDFDRLAYICKVAVRMLDNVIDMNKYPIPEIEEMSKLTRRIGVGVMGFADMLIEMGIAYDSDAALECAESIMSFIQTTVKMECELLGEEKGYCSTGKSRNSAPTTIAPTGTISIIAGASSGIEPLFALAYVRNVMDQTRLVEAYAPFEAIAREREFWSELLMEELAKVGSISHLEPFYRDQIPADVQRLFVTSHEIEPSWHVKMQAAFQNYCDNAVSKTINLPSIATIDDVRDAYIQSWKLECKGITIYRDGSKDSQPMAVETRVGTPEVVRPDALPASVLKVPTGHGHMYVTIANDPKGNPVEVFMTLGKSGGCVGTFTEALGRILSSALTYGVPVQVLADQLIGIQCPHPVFNKGAQILSVADGIGQALGGSLNGGLSGNLCPQCGGALVHEEGCAKCHECGYSSC